MKVFHPYDSYTRLFNLVWMLGKLGMAHREISPHNTGLMFAAAGRLGGYDKEET